MENDAEEDPVREDSLFRKAMNEATDRIVENAFPQASDILRNKKEGLFEENGPEPEGSTGEEILEEIDGKLKAADYALGIMAAESLRHTEILEKILLTLHEGGGIGGGGGSGGGGGNNKEDYLKDAAEAWIAIKTVSKLIGGVVLPVTEGIVALEGIKKLIDLTTGIDVSGPEGIAAMDKKYPWLGKIDEFASKLGLSGALPVLSNDQQDKLSKDYERQQTLQNDGSPSSVKQIHPHFSPTTPQEYESRRIGVPFGQMGQPAGPIQSTTNIPATRGTLSKERNQNAQQSYQFWREKGLTHDQAVAMVANEEGEGGLASVPGHGDKGSAGGIFQWHKDRRDAILAGTGIDVWSPQTTHQQQLEGAYWELKHGDKADRNWDRIANSKTTEEALGNLIQYHERSKFQQRDFNTRMGFAHRLDPILKDSDQTQIAGDASIENPKNSKEVLDHLEDMKRRGLITNEQCVSLATAAVGIKLGSGAMGANVHDWRRGDAAQSGKLVPGTPIATFLDRHGRTGNTYAIGGNGGQPGANLDHAGVFDSYIKDKDGNIVGMNIHEQYTGSGGIRERKYYFNHGYGEQNASNYYAVKDSHGNYLGDKRNPMSHYMMASRLKEIGNHNEFIYHKNQKEKEYDKFIEDNIHRRRLNDAHINNIESNQKDVEDNIHRRHLNDGLKRDHEQWIKFNSDREQYREHQRLRAFSQLTGEIPHDKIDALHRDASIPGRLIFSGPTPKSDEFWKQHIKPNNLYDDPLIKSSVFGDVSHINHLQSMRNSLGTTIIPPVALRPQPLSGGNIYNTMTKAVAPPAQVAHPAPVQSPFGNTQDQSRDRYGNMDKKSDKNDAGFIAPPDWRMKKLFGQIDNQQNGYGGW